MRRMHLHLGSLLVIFSLALLCCIDVLAEESDSKAADQLREQLEKTQDLAGRRAILGQLSRVPSLQTLQLALDWMKDDAEQREAAAEAAARIGRQLAAQNRSEVKRAMQQVIRTSSNVTTIKLADEALRESARSQNVALKGLASSPDALETDGGSGPDAAAVDGDRATYWDEVDHQPLYRFRVTFQQKTKVNTLIIVGHAFQSHSPQAFDVLCDDEVVASITDAQYDERTNETRVSFPRRECLAVELKITGYYGGSPGIRELELYDVDAGLEPSAYVTLPPGPMRLSWRPEDGELTLLNYSRNVWTFHYGADVAKPYFDPLGLVDGVSLVWKSPPDHPWHHALWFAWKGINGVNYWEEDPGMGRAEGITQVISAKVEARDDFSAHIQLQLAYHKPDETPVLTEDRTLHVTAPDEQGGYYIDWQSDFVAQQSVVLQGGTAGGGYAGLSVRVAPDTHDWRVLDADGRVDTPGPDPLAKNLHGQHARAQDFGLVHRGSGQRAGIAILEHPHSLRHPTQWHCVLEDKIPFGYFSPSPLWSEPYTAMAGARFHLAYRIVVHQDQIDRERLEKMWKQYAEENH